jgi:hypothetical protein
MRSFERAVSLSAPLKLWDTLVLVQIERDKYLGAYRTLRFGESKPFTGTCYHGQLDLFYYRDPGLKLGQSFPLWAIM